MKTDAALAVLALAAAPLLMLAPLVLPLVVVPCAVVVGVAGRVVRFNRRSKSNGIP